MAKKAQKKSEVAEDGGHLWHSPNGKFRRGNPGGPGRPFVHHDRFIEAISDEVKPAAWVKIIKRAVKDAVAGDRHARDWLSKWLLGMPEAIQGDERRTIIEILTDGSFVKWIESESHNGTEED